MKHFSKKDIITFVIIVLFSLTAIIFTNNNYEFYSEQIVKIDKIDTHKDSESTNSLGFTEDYSTQNITGIILNGNDKGKKIKLKNEITSSSVVTETYKENQKIIVEDNQIKSLKRDTYVVTMIALFILSIFIVGRLKGLLSIVSVVFNTAIFCLGLNFYQAGHNLIIICLTESIIFTLFTLVLTNGFHKKTLAATISTIISTLVLFIMTIIVSKTTDFGGVNFNGMSFLTVPAETIFLSELIIGGLGAIMDVCITISASFAELIQRNPNISKKALIKSGKEIGKDIMGTMINVLFFTYLCSGLPLFVLALRNGFTLYNYVVTNFGLELTRFLVGAIGIVLAIPITLFISIWIFKRGEKK